MLQDRSTLRIWDPRSGAETRRIRDAWPVAVHRERVAWCRENEGCRRLHVTGRKPVDLPFTGGVEGAFSPDGSLLALPVRQRSGRGRLALVDMEEGSVQTLPYARLGTHDALVWSRDGRRLFLVDRQGRLMAHEPGAERPVALPFRAHDAVITMAAG